MKRNYWICLLVFSLALNLGGLAAFGYLRLQGHGKAMTSQGPPSQPQEIWRALNLEAEQRRTLENLLPEHRRRVRDLRTELDSKRFELFEIVKRGSHGLARHSSEGEGGERAAGKVGRGGAAVLSGLPGTPETGAESRVHRFHGAPPARRPWGPRPPAAQMEAGYGDWGAPAWQTLRSLIF